MESICTLITGAGSDIGRETAIRLSAGSQLILSGRNEARLEETRRLCADPGRHALWLQDLCDLDKFEGSLRSLLSGRRFAIETFIHCAGVFKLQPLRGASPAHALELMRVNVLSAAEIVRLLSNKQINQQRLKSVVFVSSIAASFGAKAMSLYCASKGALDALRRALAVELAPAVRVNSVLPGGIRTSATEAIFADPETAARALRDVPLGEGKPADVASAIEFLASDKARWITGQQLVVDGGRTVNMSA